MTPQEHYELAENYASSSVNAARIMPQRDSILYAILAVAHALLSSGSPSSTSVSAGQNTIQNQ